MSGFWRRVGRIVVRAEGWDRPEGTRRLCIDMQPWMLDDLRRLADQQGCDVSEFVRRATAHYRQACIEGRVLPPERLS